MTSGNTDFDYAEYRRFIATKSAHEVGGDGFKLTRWPDLFRAHQTATLDFACYKARGAAFLDTGLGKSGIEVAFAQACVEETNKPALILTPLSVTRQMKAEADKFGFESTVIREQLELAGPGVYISHYECLGKIDPDAFACIVLDESSILKSFTGSTKRALCEAFAQTRFRLAATATPAPNDHMELGQHSDFLGVMGSKEMLCRWFINDTSTASQDWRLKGHAVDGFWSWVASWARAASLPSDLGGDDTGYILPELDSRTHVVRLDLTENAGEEEGQGMLFRLPNNSATSIHQEKRLTLNERVRRAAELATHDDPAVVWCETNDESAALAKAIPGAVEVHGSLKPEEKAERLWAFADGEYRVIVSKPKLAGFGLNWQHCNRMVFASISHSYEQYYQAVRRCQRFGQTRRVRVDTVIAETEATMWANVQRKAADHDGMKAAMSAAMVRAQSESHKKIYTRDSGIILPDFLTGGQRHAA